MRSIPCTFGANRSMTSLAIVLSVMYAFINNGTVAVVNIEGKMVAFANLANDWKAY